MGYDSTEIIWPNKIPQGGEPDQADSFHDKFSSVSYLKVSSDDTSEVFQTEIQH